MDEKQDIRVVSESNETIKESPIPEAQQSLIRSAHGTLIQISIVHANLRQQYLREEARLLAGIDESDKALRVLIESIAKDTGVDLNKYNFDFGTMAFVEIQKPA